MRHSLVEGCPPLRLGPLGEPSPPGGMRVTSPSSTLASVAYPSPRARAMSVRDRPNRLRIVTSGCAAGAVPLASVGGGLKGGSGSDALRWVRSHWRFASRALSGSLYGMGSAPFLGVAYRVHLAYLRADLQILSNSTTDSGAGFRMFQADMRPSRIAGSLTPLHTKVPARDTALSARPPLILPFGAW